MTTIAKDPKWIKKVDDNYQVNFTALSDDGRVCITGTSVFMGTGDFSVLCYDSQGNLIWKDPLGENVYSGVFWVAISGNGKIGAAGGDYQAKGRGFIRIYEIEKGSRALVEFDTPARVNEVEISQDGSYVVCVSENILYLFSRTGESYELTTKIEEGNDPYFRSIGISKDGKCVIAGAQYYDEKLQYTKGTVYLFKNDNGKLTLINQPWQGASGILRVVSSETGSFLAASTNKGEVHLFQLDYFERTSQPLWTYKPDVYDWGIAYPLAIATPSDGEVYVASGANIFPLDYAKPNYVFMLQNMPEKTESGYSPKLLWMDEVPYFPDPGMNMDKEARLLTVTMGEPTEHGKETPGYFYLYDALSGNKHWIYGPVQKMDWPMAINPSGSAIFGGDDGGNLYYWGAPASEGDAK